MVGVQPPLGRADCAHRRAAGAAQPESHNAVGPLLANELCWFGYLHPAARRPGELASWATSLLAEFCCARRPATSCRGAPDCGFRSIRMCGAGRQVESAVGHLCFSGDVCSWCCTVTDTRAFGQGRERSNACRDEPHPYRAARYYGGLQPMAGAAFTQEPHGQHCQLPLAAVPCIGWPCSAELPRIALTIVGRVDAALKRSGEVRSVQKRTSKSSK